MSKRYLSAGQTSRRTYWLALIDRPKGCGQSHFRKILRQRAAQGKKDG